MADWEWARRNLSLERLEHFNFAEDVIDKWAQDPSRIALRYVDRFGDETRWTFRQLADASSRLANVLRHRGLERGQPVFVLMDGTPDWWVAVLAVLRAGGVLVLGRPDFRRPDVAHCIDSVEARLAIVNQSHVDMIPDHLDTLVYDSPDLIEQLASASPHFPSLRLRSGENALLRFTSGTTGPPKLVLHTHASGFLFRGTARDYRPGDLDWQPIMEAGQCLWSGAWCDGAAILVQDLRHSGSDPRARLETLARYPVTHFLSVPAMYQLCLAEDPSTFSFPRLRSCVSIGGPLSPQIFQDWKAATGIMIHQSYSQSEIGMDGLFRGQTSGVEPKPGTLGKPDPRLGFAIIDADGHPLPPNAVGDIAFQTRPQRLAPLFRGYWRDSEATAACFRGDWYLTRDLGVMDDEGYVRLTSRADEVIKTFGLRVGPSEIESALIDHPAVLEAAAVGMPNRLAGEVIKAFVVLADGSSASPGLELELREHVERLRGSYRCPQAIEFVTALPKTERGKLRRVILRDLERKRHEERASRAG